MAKVKEDMSKALFREFDPQLPVRENFSRMYYNMANYYLNNPDELSFGEQYANSPFIYSSTREENSKLFKPLKDFFEKAKKEQIIKDIPDEMLIAMLFGILKAQVRLHINNQLHATDKLIKKAQESCWDAFKL